MASLPTEPHVEFADFGYFTALIGAATGVAVARDRALVVAPPSTGGFVWDRVPLDGVIVIDPMVGRAGAPRPPRPAPPVRHDLGRSRGVRTRRRRRQRGHRCHLRGARSFRRPRRPADRPADDPADQRVPAAHDRTRTSRGAPAPASRRSWRSWTSARSNATRSGRSARASTGCWTGPNPPTRSTPRSSWSGWPSPGSCWRRACGSRSTCCSRPRTTPAARSPPNRRSPRSNGTTRRWGNGRPRSCWTSWTASGPRPCVELVPGRVVARTSTAP